MLHKSGICGSIRAAAGDLMTTWVAEEGVEGYAPVVHCKAKS